MKDTCASGTAVTRNWARLEGRAWLMNWSPFWRRSLCSLQNKIRWVIINLLERQVVLPWLLWHFSIFDLPCWKAVCKVQRTEIGIENPRAARTVFQHECHCHEKHLGQSGKVWHFCHVADNATRLAVTIWNLQASFCLSPFI